VESFHRTLRKECLGWWTYKPSEGEDLKNEVQQYLDYYHYEWPQLGFGLRPPSTTYFSRLAWETLSA
jgi:hypothetical protein